MTALLGLSGIVIVGMVVAWAVGIVKPTKKSMDLLGSEISSRVNNALIKEFETLASVDAIQEEKVKVIEELAKLKAERAAEAIKYKAEKEAQNEEFIRKERELTHKAGLLAKQHDADIEIATKKANLDAERQIIEAKGKSIEETAKFQRERFESEVSNLRELLEGMQAQLKIIAVPGAERVRVNAGN